MSFFTEVSGGNLDGLEQKLLGPDYAYSKQIKTPTEMDLSGVGSWDAIIANAAGLESYMKLLVEGGGHASKVAGPLGDRFFLQTGAKCKDIVSGQDAIRSIYINNIPDGNIPLLSSAAGANFQTFEGLLPSTLSSLAGLNPLAIFQAFTEGTNPDCKSISLETVDASNNASMKSGFLTISDIKGMNPCWFSDGKNPVTMEKHYGCNPSRVGFENLQGIQSHITDCTSIITYLYFISLFLLFCYILTKVNKPKR